MLRSTSAQRQPGDLLVFELCDDEVRQPAEAHGERLQQARLVARQGQHCSAAQPRRRWCQPGLRLQGRGQRPPEQAVALRLECGSKDRR